MVKIAQGGQHLVAMAKASPAWLLAVLRGAAD